MATSYYHSFLVKNDKGSDVQVRYIKTWIENVSVASIGVANTVESSGKYGINGTFFDPSTKKLVGIAVNNGVAITPDGADNDVFPRGTLYRLMNGTVGVRPVRYATDITPSISDLKWAIGGISLFLDRSFPTATDYFNAISAEVGDVNVQFNRPRTAIGFDGRDQVYLVTFCHYPDWTQDRWQSDSPYGVDLYEMHQIMKSNLGCVMGINLDGGGSTAIAYKLAPGYPREVRAVLPTTVLSMVTMPGLSFENVLP